MQLGTNPNLKDELNKYEPRIFTLDTIITFGKHKDKGYTIRELLYEDPKYVAWMIETFKNDEFDGEILYELDQIDLTADYDDCIS